MTTLRLVQEVEGKAQTHEEPLRENERWLYDSERHVITVYVRDQTKVMGERLTGAFYNVLSCRESAA